MKLLFVTQDINWPPMSGGEIRQYQSLQALKRCGLVDVVAFHSGLENAKNQAFDGCNQVFFLKDSSLKRGPGHEKMYRSTIGRLSLTFGHYVPFHYLSCLEPERVRWFENLVDKEKYDVLWFVEARTALALHWIDRSRTVLDGVDFDSIREYYNLRSTSWYGAKIANYIDILKLTIWECTFPMRFARVARCSHADKRRFPFSNVIVIPNGTSILPERREKPVPTEVRVLFVGSLGFVPNAIGLSWFVSKVWPRILKKFPDAILDIVGNGAPDWLRKLHQKNGIYLHGFVADIAPIYDRAAISIAPLLAGGGTRLKILESLANKTAVVATPIGAYGLDLGPKHGVVLEKSPNRFAKACSDLISDPEHSRTIAMKGFHTVASRFDWNTIQQRIIQTVEQVSRISERGT